MELVTVPRIFCLGEGMVEERIAADGTASRHYGGDTLNTAIHLARLGCDVAYVTAVGSDDASDALVAAWAAEGLDTSLVMRHPDRTVGRYRIALDEAGERSFSYDRSESAVRELFALADAEWRARVVEAGSLLFSLISLAVLPIAGRAALIELARDTRARGGLVVFDGNYRPALWESRDAARAWRDMAIETSDIGLPTLDDEMALGAARDADQVAGEWSALGCSEVLVKAGVDGCRLLDGTVLPPPAKLSPVDTSGAGDAFNAGYLAARLQGAEPREAALAGHRVAGWTIMRSGGIPPRDAAYP